MLSGQFMRNGCVLALLCCSCNLFSASLESKYLSMSFNENGTFSVKDKVNPSDAGTFEGQAVITEGLERKPVKFDEVKISNAENKVVVAMKGKELSWKLEFAPKERIILINSEITNHSDRELRLEPALKMTGANNKKLNKFWDGNNESSNLEKGKEFLRRGIKNEVQKHVGASIMPFPVSAVFGNSSAFFVGSVPFEPISYYSARCLPSEKNIELDYSMRIVVSPEKSTVVRMLLGTTSSAYGGMEAVVQCYYDSLPELWAPVVGQENPYIWGVHGQYLNWWEKPDYEKSRRLHVVLEWTYCPYKRSGEMNATSKELWDYQPHNAFKPSLMGGTSIDFGKLSQEDYLKIRKENFHKYARKFGWMFYNTAIGTWAEINLAKEKYPDAINHDKSVMYILTTWSTHHDQEIRMFPMGTSFAKVFEKDMEFLARDLNLPGFALDCAYAGAYYRGPAVKDNLPGRAWDDDGVYIDQSVAINNVVGFIHDIVKTEDNSKKLVSFSNGYLKGDYLMAECPFIQSIKFKRWMPLGRYHMGPRPGCTHGHGYCFRDVVPNWRDKNEDDFKKIMPKLADYVIFNQFKYGLTGSHIEFFGNPQVLYVIPEVIEMMRAGWQAYMPASFEQDDKIFYTARYGKGAGTFFFFGNPYEENMDKMVKIDNRGISPDNNDTYLFVKKMRTKASTTNIVNKNFTEINMPMLSRTPLLYEAVCGLETPAEAICEVSSEKGIDRQLYKVQMKESGKFSSPVNIRKIRNFKLDTVTCNGRKLSVKESLSGYTTEKCDFSDKSVLEISYISTIFHISAEKLLSFQFVDKNNNVAFAVQLPPNANDSEKEMAERFAAYFKFCADNKVINSKSPAVQMTSSPDAAKNDGFKVVVISGENRGANDAPVPAGISMSTDGKTLFVKAENQDKADALIKELFYVMDKKFTYIFPFKAVMGLYQDMLNHFKMNGKAMPYNKYFEE